MATIVIDPGHYGGYNTGVCLGYHEGNTMLVLATFLGDALICRGANVIYTRISNQQNPSLAERGQMAANADLFISMHSDASDNAAARGVTSYYSIMQPASRPFATDIGMAAADAMGNQFRGALTRASTDNPSLDYYGVIRSAVAAGAKNAFIIEHGFHTNAEDCAILNNIMSLKAIGEAESEIIAAYLGLTRGGASCCNFSYTVRPGDTLYTIGRLHGVPWQTIASMNNINSPYRLHPGETLTLPCIT